MRGVVVAVSVSVVGFLGWLGRHCRRRHRCRTHKAGSDRGRRLEIPRVPHSDGPGREGVPACVSRR